MLTKINQRILLAAVLAAFATPVSAQGTVVQDPNDWAKKMFDSLEHDFGVVARNAEVTHRFKVTNLYKQDVHIANVTASCGCTTPKFEQTPVKSLDSTYIDISMDTNKFQHAKSSNVTITFDQPLYASVTVPVKVYIRTDVVVTPNAINFGGVEQGGTPEQNLAIAYAYDSLNGRPDWKITNVVTQSKWLQAQVVEKNRSNGAVNGNGAVNYELVVKLLPNAPLGDLRDRIVLVTNDQNAPEIPIMAKAHVEADVTITPSLVQFGSVEPGATQSRTVIFRGHKPFAIEKVECDSAREAFKMTELTKEVKPYHILSLQFTAPKESGPFTEKFIVTVVGRKQPISFQARAVVAAPQQQVGLPNP